ncbi:hypothetical protein ACJX0J_031307, partial [Zea mays]
LGRATTQMWFFKIVSSNVYRPFYFSLMLEFVSTHKNLYKLEKHPAVSLRLFFLCRGYERAALTETLGVQIYSIERKVMSLVFGKPLNYWKWTSTRTSGVEAYHELKVEVEEEIAYVLENTHKVNIKNRRFEKLFSLSEVEAYHEHELIYYIIIDQNYGTLLLLSIFNCVQHACIFWVKGLINNTYFLIDVGYMSTCIGDIAYTDNSSFPEYPNEALCVGLGVGWRVSKKTLDQAPQMQPADDWLLRLTIGSV